ncbi:unnamed protein product, partial [marine sediment metagenome]
MIASTCSVIEIPFAKNGNRKEFDGMLSSLTDKQRKILNG